MVASEWEHPDDLVITRQAILKEFIETMVGSLYLLSR